MIKLICVVMGLALTLITEGASPAHSQIPPVSSDVGEVVFIVDHSGSMTEASFGGGSASRWNVVRQAFPEWLGLVRQRLHAVGRQDKRAEP